MQDKAPKKASVFSWEDPFLLDEGLSFPMTSEPITSAAAFRVAAARITDVDTPARRSNSIS